MKNIIRYIPLVAAALLMTACQDNDEENFDNKAFINAPTMTSETIIKGTMPAQVQTLNVELARPAEKEMTASFAVNSALVDTYDQAEMLPADCYTVDNATVTIPEGSVKSTDAQFTFKDLSSLDRNTRYVLPVEAKSADIPFTTSSNRYYYIFRAGALINIVADIEKNYCEVVWKTPDLVQDMHQVTFEALVYARDFDKLISTVMGIEGKFLMRIGDAGYPSNRIQIATGRGNFSTTADLPTNKWTHVAMTYDADKGEMIVYMNGLKACESTSFNCGTVNIVGNGTDRNFLIGKSYDDNRDLRGCISEVRVWNVVRTQEEIANNFYTIDPNTEGLVGYWKFDDNSSFVVKDYSPNGNDAKAANSLTWKSVSLPEK